MTSEAKPKLFAGLLAALLLFSLVTKTIRIGIPSDFYFDEVYHGFTATRYLHFDLQAYDPWATPPPKVAYEWTHPPLAKLLMAGFMAVFGETPFGWRIGSVLFGTLAILFLALLARELFGSNRIALWSAAFLSIEGLSFAQSRIAMNDSYFVCFLLFTFWQYLKWRRTPAHWKHLALTGVGIGLMAATKWTTLYALAGLGGDLLYRFFIRKEMKLERKLLLIPIFLGVVPALIYLLSYWQIFWAGKGWDFFVTVQQQMWWYHSKLTATHGYQSKPIHWILNLRPVWFHVQSSAPGMTANIYNLGNSVILLTGLFAVLHAILIEKRWSYALGFTVVIYFLLWFPWNFSPRIMFFYHYTPAVPFLCILLARFLDTRPNARAIVATLAVFWFALFYPHSTAIAVPQEFADKIYFFLPGWR